MVVETIQEDHMEPRALFTNNLTKDTCHPMVHMIMLLLPQLVLLVVHLLFTVVMP